MSDDATLDLFFGILNDPALPAYHDVDQLMKQVFCAEVANPTPPPDVFPCVGITDHGPQFDGAAEVKDLFERLFGAFPDMAWTPVPGAPRLYSKNDYSPKTIGSQIMVWGTHKGDWFEKGHKHYSPPLSDIHPDKVHLMRVPACAVFAFDAKHRIRQLALYMDRHRMKEQLTPAKTVDISEVISLLVKGLSRMSNT